MTINNSGQSAQPSDNVDRAAHLYQWRRMLDWDTADVAKQLGVSARTVNLWEAGSQDMPDSRWLLFVLLVQKAADTRMKADIEAVTPGGPSLAVVLGDDRMPIDVVSRENYAGHVIDGDYGMIASVAVDRQTGKERLHRTRFRVSHNAVIVRAAEDWAAYRDVVVKAHERWAFLLHRGLVHSTLRAELKNPVIAKLKADIEAAGRACDAVGADASTEERQRLDQQFQQAIKALQDAVAASAD